MRRITFLLALIALTFSMRSSNAQLPNESMYVLRNLYQHTLNGFLYSAIWGYRAPDGREYAILGCPNGTAFIDVTDTSDIREVGYVTGVNSNWREMKTYSHYAYVVSEGNNSGLQIIDLQYLPDSVHFVKKFTAPNHTTTHTISQSGPYLYLSGANSSFVSNGGIAVLDLTTDPENPVLRGKWTSFYVHDCRIVDDTIYTANIFDENVSIIDARNKNTLSTVHTFINLPGSGPHNTALTDDRRRLFVTDEIGTAPFRLKVWNIESRTNPVFVTAWQPTGITNSIVHNIEIYGNYAVVAHYSAGVRLLNISNPDSPQEIAWYDTYPQNNNQSYNGCWGVYMFPSGKIVASDRQTGLYVLKTSFPLTGVSQSVGGEVPEGFSLSQNYPNPFNPVTKISFDIPTSENVSLKVFDMQGREVATLVNDFRQSGRYSVELDASLYGLSSGTYLYRIQAGNFSETKKLTLLK